MSDPMALYLALDGCHGVGTSTHADALAVALRTEHIHAWAYHHPRHPAHHDGVARVAWYAGARAQLRDERERIAASLHVCEDTAPRVVVMDRGPISGVVHALATSGEDRRREALTLASADARAWVEDRGLVWAWLTAPDATLNRRIAARGEHVDLFAEERAQWPEAVRSTRLRPSLTVDTGRARKVVEAELVAWALGVIGGAR